MAGRVETKVIAGGAGAGAGAVVATLIVWIVGVAAFGGTVHDTTGAIAAVPPPVSDAIWVVVSALGSLAAGWSAPHTPRTDLFPSTLLLQPPPAEVTLPIPHVHVDDKGTITDPLGGRG